MNAFSVVDIYRVMFSFETTSASEHHNFGRILCLVKNHNFYPLCH